MAFIKDYGAIVATAVMAVLGVGAAQAQLVMQSKDLNNLKELTRRLELHDIAEKGETALELQRLRSQQEQIAKGADRNQRQTQKQLDDLNDRIEQLLRLLREQN